VAAISLTQERDSFAVPSHAHAHALGFSPHAHAWQGFSFIVHAKNNQKKIGKGVDAKGISDMLLIVTEKGSRLWHLIFESLICSLHCLHSVFLLWNYPLAT